MSQNNNFGNPLTLILLMLVINFFSVCLFAQVSGKTYDAQTLSPLPGVQIICSQKQTVSNTNGYFETDTFGITVFYHNEYKTDTVFLTQHSNHLKIYMIPKETVLSEIIIQSPYFFQKPDNAPSSFVRIKNSDLLKGKSTSYTEILNSAPGVFIHKGTLSTSRVTVRGIGSRSPYATNRIKAYYEDLPLTTAEGVSTIDDIDPLMINQIDIIKGPKSAIYGDGLGGLIRLRSKEVSREGFSSDIFFEAGMFNTYKPSMKLSFKNGLYSGNLFVSNTRTKGYRENSKYNRYNVYLDMSRRSDKLKTDLTIIVTDLKAYIPSSLDSETFLNEPEKAAQNWSEVSGFEDYVKLLTGLKNELDIAENWSLYSLIYTNHSDAYESRPFNILDDKSISFGLKNYIRFQKKGFQLIAGQEFIDETYAWEIYQTINGCKGSKLNEYNEKRDAFSFFADLSYTVQNKLVIESGFSRNYRTYKLIDLFPDSLNNSGEYSYDPVSAPFIGMNVNLFKAIHLYASYSYGFSYPSVEETLLPSGLINTELKPETGSNYEAGMRYRTKKGKFKSDVCFYSLNVKNLLVTERISEDIFTGINAGSSKHKGVELNAVAFLNTKGNNNFPKTDVGFSFSRSENTFKKFVNDSIDLSGKHLPGIPEFTLSASANMTYDFGLKFTLQTKYFGKQYMNDLNNELYSKYALTDLKLSYEFQFKEYDLKIYAGLDNMFDKQYASMLLVNAPSFQNRAPRYYYPGKPRYFYGGFSIHL